MSRAASAGVMAWLLSWMSRAASVVEWWRADNAMEWCRG